MWETVGRNCKYYNHLWNSRSNSKINVKKRTIHLTYSTVACGIKNLSYEPDCLLWRNLPLHVFWVLFCSAHLPLDLSLDVTCMLSPVSLSCGRQSWSGSPSEGPQWELTGLVPFLIQSFLWWVLTQFRNSSVSAILYLVLRKYHFNRKMPD